MCHFQIVPLLVNRVLFQVIQFHIKSVDAVLNTFTMSHTCPMFYKPYDKLIPGIDQSGVDESMEKWLDTVHDLIEEKCSGNQTKWEWYCGHWHIDRRIDTFRFMYDDYLRLTKI